MQPVPFHERARLARAAVAAASVEGADAETFLRKVIAAVGRAVPHEAGGWTVTDPGTLLWTAGVMHGLPLDVGAAIVENEILGDDALQFRELVRRRRPSGVLSAATGGELARSARYRTLYAPHGIRDELRVAAVADGACFANACLLRRAGAAPFSAQEVALVEALSKDVAHGLRMAMARPGAAGGTTFSDGVPGVLTVDDDLRLLSATGEAERWLDALGPAFGFEMPLPQAVVSVVRRARALLLGGGADGPPRARVRARCGTWVAIHASALTQAPRTWAVVIEPARPAEVLPLIARAHELTAREHEVFGLLLRGAPDKLIAERLLISAHTAREHVRNVLRKLGARSRAELQALMLDTCFAEPAFAMAAS